MWSLPDLEPRLEGCKVEKALGRVANFGSGGEILESIFGKIYFSLSCEFFLRGIALLVVLRQPMEQNLFIT